MFESDFDTSYGMGLPFLPTVAQLPPLSEDLQNVRSCLIVLQTKGPLYSKGGITIGHRLWTHISYHMPYLLEAASLLEH